LDTIDNEVLELSRVNLV